VPPTYATLGELKAPGLLNITTTEHDALLSSYLEAASRAIDRYCGRQFYASGRMRRRYTATSPDLVFIDDLLSIVALRTDEDWDGVAETVWEPEEYVLQPYNALPKLWVETTDPPRRVFPTRRGVVEVEGIFGYCQTGEHPEPIRTACLIIASRLFRAGTTGFYGPVGSPDLQAPSPADQLVLADRTVKQLLDPYRRVASRPL
jgi:hypothetical protein